MQEHLTPAASLPADGTAGTLVGRAWVPGAVPGPSVVAIREDGVFDLSRSAPTMPSCSSATTRWRSRAAGRAHRRPRGDPRQQRLGPARPGAADSWRPATCRRSRPAA